MEKSIEYKLLGKINFKGNKYNVYIDAKYRKFYLKIIDTEYLMNLTYPTLEEFIQLNRLFGINYIEDKCYLTNRDHTNQKFSDRKTVKFIPKVITKTGLISLATALLLSGCTLNNNAKTSDSNQTETVEVMEEESKTIEEMTDEELLKYYGVSSEKIEDGIYALNEMTIDGKTYTVCKNVDEFKEQVGMEGIPTYDDLINAIKNNGTITGRYEEWFIEAINNLSQNEEFNGVDFSVLLYNIQKMQLREKNADEIREESDTPTTQAYFAPSTKDVAINPETVTKVIYLHEVLGHACTETITEDNIYFRSQAVITVLDRNEDGSINNIYNSIIGEGLEEGKSDMLAEVALNNEEISLSSYDIEKESVRELKETLGLSWADIINNSMSLKMLAKMSKIGIENPIKYLDNTDTLYHATMFEDFDDSIRFKNNMGDFLIDYAQSQIKSGRTVDEVSSQISQMIQASPAYPNYIGTKTFAVKDLTNMQEYEKYVINSIQELKNDKQELQSDKEEGMEIE